LRLSETRSGTSALGSMRSIMISFTSVDIDTG
jgi:hypothetical protein